MYSTLTTKEKRTYDPEEAYDEAMRQLEAVKSNLPVYDSRYEQSLRELYDQIAQRPKFTYDPSGDALYQSYKRSYAQQGRLAMEDAMGQAAGLTGGYGSSYAQSVGQQQYGAYLQKLSDVFPETYGMAYQQYLDEGSTLRSRYDLLSEQADEEYSRYQDRLAAYYEELGYLQDQVDTAYNRGVAEEQSAYERQKAEEEEAYKRQQDTLDRQETAYNRLVEMMLTMGYQPDASELRAAGMTDKQMNAYLSYYNSLTAPAVTGGGSGSKKKKEIEDTSAYSSAMSEAQKQLKKKDVETVNGEIARKVARGELDAATAQQVIIALTKQQYGG